MTDPLPGSKAAHAREKKSRAGGDASALYDPARPMPTSVDMERSVLSCMMQAPDFAVPAVMGGLVSEDFAIEAHALLYDALLANFSAGKPLDVVTMTGWFYDRDLIDKVGGPAFVSDVFTATPNPTHARHYAAEVKEKSLQRQLLHACMDAAGHIFDSCPDAAARREIQEDLLSAIAGLQKIEMHSRKGIRTGREVLASVADTMVTRHRHRGKILGLTVGFPDLDRTVNGFQRGDVVVIAARPAMGKTSLATAFAEAVAVDMANTRNVPVLFISLEMSDEQIMERSVLGRARIGLGQGRTGFFTDAEGMVWRVAREVLEKFPNENPESLRDEIFCTAMERLSPYWEKKGRTVTRGLIEDSKEQALSLSTALAAIATGRLHSYDSYGVTTQEIRARIKEWCRQIGWSADSTDQCPPLVVLDYVQLVRASEKRNRGDKRLEVDECMKMLKGLAKEMHLCIMPLAQVGRSSEENPGKMPSLKDLKESGSIEEDSDYVIFVHRPCYYFPWHKLKEDVQKRWQQWAEGRQKSKAAQDLGERWTDDDEKSAGQKFYESQAELGIRKARHGPTGDIEVLWHYDQVRFSSKTPRLYANDKEMRQQPAAPTDGEELFD